MAKDPLKGLMPYKNNAIGLNEVKVMSKN